MFGKYRVIWGNDKFIAQTEMMSSEEEASKIFDEKEVGYDKCHWVFMTQYYGYEYKVKHKYINDPQIVSKMPKI